MSNKNAAKLQESIAHNPEEVAKLLNQFNRELEKGGDGKSTEAPKLEDDGPINIKIGASSEMNQVIIDFGKPVVWIGVAPEQCAGIVKGLIAKMKLLGHEFKMD